MRQEITSEQQEQRNQELLEAAKQGNIGLCQELIELGADINTQKGDGSSPYFYETVKADADHGNTALFYAIEQGNTEFCQKLIEWGADVNFKGICDNRPLHLAAQLNRHDIALLLLEHKAEINAKNMNNVTPFYFAALRQHAKLCKILRKQGAEISITILHQASANGYIEICKLLLNYGVNPNARGLEEKTPLHYAANNGETNTCELLCANGAEINLTDKHNLTALNYAVRSGKAELIKFLISEGAEISERLMQDIHVDIRTEALTLHYEKKQNEISIENELQEKLATSKLITIPEQDTLTNIFTTIKRGKYDATIINNTLSILYENLPNIENNDPITTGSFKHLFRQNLRDLTEWSIKTKISHMIGRHLDNFHETNANLKTNIPGDVIAYTASFLTLSDLQDLAQVAHRDTYQETTNELKPYLKALSQEYKDNKIIISDKFYNEEILPLTKRQNLPSRNFQQETCHSTAPIITNLPREQILDEDGEEETKADIERQTDMIINELNINTESPNYN